MTIPNSVIIVILVLAWLIMLVPMYVRRHDPVHENDEGANFRMLKSHSTKKRMKLSRRTDRGMADELADAELSEDVSDEEYDSVELTTVESEYTETDEFVGEYSDEDDAADYSETVEYDEDGSYRPAARGAYRDEPARPVRETPRETVRETARDVEREGTARRPVAEPVHHGGHRVGRGGYDAEAAEIARAYRYAQRQRVALILLVATVAFAGAAVFVMPGLWAGAGVSGALLALYLWYLRRQVTIEEDIRERRLARLQRAREIRPERDYEPRAAYEPTASQVPESAVHRRGRVVLDLDDDDPGFDDLEYYAPVEYRRASGQ
ncbi:hypothetical protein D1871_18515 [Nakamurella silvestris]|nr:hypothetical protein D1871_18515 [Nakamurella silvestris]